jgi:predicted regulator of amino acid metabolism with ACT domain
MWKNIKNISAAVADISIIVGKEIAYISTKTSTATEGVTSKLSTKAANIRANYEQHLADRKAGITTPKTEVVTQSETPRNIVPVN